MQANLFKRTAILIDSSSVQSRLYQDILIANGFDVYIAKSAMDGLQKIKESKHDLAVINTEIAEESFLEKFISKVRSEKSTELMPIVGLSIHAENSKKNIAKILDGFFTKPISIDTFIASIFECIERKVCGCESSTC